MPLLAWSFVSLTIAIFALIHNGEASEVTLIWIIKNIIKGFVGGPWFLWAIWLFSVLIIINKKYFNDSLIVYYILLILTFITPDSLASSYRLSLFKFMYPYFVLAYLFNKNDAINKFREIYRNKHFVLTVVIIFVLTLLLFNHDTYIYTSHYTLLGNNIIKQFYNDMLRFVSGLFGSVSMLYFIYVCYKYCDKGFIRKIMLYTGKNTLGIYIISGYFYTNILSVVTASFTGLNYLCMIIETIIIWLLSLLINYLLQQTKITNELFLGGR